MKKKILSTLLTTGLLVTVGSALADDRHGCKNSKFGKHGRLHFRMYKKLDLTDQQRQQIKAIFKEIRPKNKSERFEERQSHMQARRNLIQSDTLDEVVLNRLADKVAEQVKTRFVSRVKAEHKIWLLLTPEQRNNLIERQKEHMKRKQQRFQKHMKNNEKSGN